MPGASCLNSGASPYSLESLFGEFVEVEWNKVTENYPPEGVELLVWTGHYMIVSEAHYYDDQTRKLHADVAVANSASMYNTKERLHLMNCTGRFLEFGLNHYFDNPKVYWAELPKPPEQK